MIASHFQVWCNIYSLTAKPDDNSDSLYYVTDPDVEHIPLKELLCKVRILDTECYKFLILATGIPVLESATLWLRRHKSSGGSCELCSLVIVFMGLMLDQGNPVNSSDTIYFSGNELDKAARSLVIDNILLPVTDQWGNACSYIQSNYQGQL